MIVSRKTLETARMHLSLKTILGEGNEDITEAEKVLTELLDSAEGVETFKMSSYVEKD